MSAAAQQEAAVDVEAPAVTAPAPSPSAEPEVVAPPVKPAFGGASKADVAALRGEVARLSQASAALVESYDRQLEELRGQLARLASSMGRSDILTPPATVEQLRAAHKAGAFLLVLRDLAIAGSAGMRFTAGTKIEARQYPLDRLIELIETGRLSVAVVP